MEDLIIGGHKFNSRLFIGTGKFSSSKIMAEALKESGTELVTVALKRIDLTNKDTDDILSFIDTNKYIIVPNTSGARTADEAIKIGNYSRAAGFKWIKLEIHPDPNYLLPDPMETLKAAEQLVKNGHNVMPYINADPVLAKHLEEIGCVCIMPLGSPIGSNKGITNKDMLEIIIEQSNIPVVIDAGIGLPSHAAAAIELGADAVLINTSIAAAGDPINMAKAYKLAIQAAELAVKSQPPVPTLIASPSSPLTLFLNT